MVSPRRLIIGDIHGCFEELQELLDRAGLSREDEIIALGDIVDRGPASPPVLEFFQTQPNARSLQGNHERKHIRSHRGEIKPALSQRITRQQFGERYQDRPQTPGRGSTSGAIFRLRNWPSEGEPTSRPPSTITLPRRIVNTGHPVTSRPSQML